ncbi:MAG: PAS domain S-box protein [bacterium]
MGSVIEILRNTSKRKLLIFLFSLLMLMNSVFVYLYFPAKLKEQQLQSYIDKARTLADLGSINVGSALYFDDIESVEEYIRSLTGVRNIVAIIIFDTLGVPITISNVGTGGDIIQSISMTKISGFSTDRNYYGAIKSIYFKNKKLGKISVVMSLKDLNKDVSESKQLITIISLIMFLFGILAIIAISSIFVNPLVNLVNTFSKISNGDLSTRTDIRTKDEFGRLGEYFNSMVDKVERTQKKLFEMNIALEEKVEERTLDLRKEIEERKRAENILRESEERIRNIFENAPFGIYQTSLEGKILFANPALMRMLKYDTIGTLLSLDVSEQGYLRQHDRAVFLEKLNRESRVYDFHAQWIAKDGSIIYISENARLVKDDIGKNMYIEGMVEDITERLKAEEKLRENEEKYRNIFEKFQDVYFKIDLKGFFIDLSPSVYNFSGYEAVDLIGRTIDTVYFDRAKKFGFLKMLVKDKKISNFEMVLTRKDGDNINVNVNAQFEYDVYNKPEFISGTLHDISELKRVEKQLIELNFTKDKFFSIIAHDLRNPISSFMQGTDILENDYDTLTDDERADIIISLNRTSKGLLELLEDLLTWSRAQTGKISFTPDQADIFPIISNNISLLELQAGNKKIFLKQESEENTFGFFDVNMVNTVIRNLISNAIKFTPEGGMITIGSKIENNSIKVWVKDTGVGISEENINKLFRIDTTITTDGTAKEKGTGLGLILCKELIEKNRGTIWIESELNKGSSFIFTLPTTNESINNYT